MKISLPDNLKLTCPHCRKAFTVSTREIGGIQSLGCPYCLKPMEMLDSLPPQLRRLIYHKARRHIELLAQNFRKPPAG